MGLSRCDVQWATFLCCTTESTYPAQSAGRRTKIVEAVLNSCSKRIVWTQISAHLLPLLWTYLDTKPDYYGRTLAVNARCAVRRRRTEEGREEGERKDQAWSLRIFVEVSWMVSQDSEVGRRGVTMVSRLNVILAYFMVVIPRVTPLNTMVTPPHKWLTHLPMGIQVILIKCFPRFQTWYINLPCHASNLIWSSIC